MGTDPFNLDRFVESQNPVFERVLDELRSGRKTSHWMWFVFPQVAGLGRSSTARWFSIASVEEAQAYLAHPILGLRLRQCVQIVNDLEGLTLREIFGQPDDLKFRSSMTLFASVAEDGHVFDAALKKYCHGERDPLTLSVL